MILQQSIFDLLYNKIIYLLAYLKKRITEPKCLAAVLHFSEYAYLTYLKYMVPKRLSQNQTKQK